MELYEDKNEIDNKETIICDNGFKTLSYNADICDDVTKKVGLFQDEIKQIEDETSKLNRRVIEYKNKKEPIIYEDIKHSLNVISQKLNKSFSVLSGVFLKIGVTDDYSVSIGNQEIPKLKFVKNGDIIEIIFPCLLPKRVKYEDKKNLIELKRVSLMYGKALLDYFLNNEIRYSEKVVLCFIHHYKTKSLVKDHDNFNLKMIIDYIAVTALIDDSAEYCSHYMDYVIDETKEDYSTVYIVPENKFTDFLQEGYK